MKNCKISPSNLKTDTTLSFFSPSFQDKLDKMQIGSSEDVNDLNYYYDNEWWVARGGN